jgi:hypothetical protein
MDFPLTSSQSALDLAGTHLNTVPKRYFGKYRGKVIDNVDPLFLARIMAEVPAISEIPTSWAMPCVPYAGMEVGLYAIPPIGANVWIEFEAGNPNYPIWTGCFWEEGQVPLGAPLPGMTILKTECITLIINDDPEVGGLTLEVSPPAVATPISITLNSAGIQVETEAVFELTSQESNLISEALTIESTETNLTGEALTIEAGETNLTGEALTIEAGETNISGAALTIETAETNIAGDALTIETVETNILSAAITTESAETNIASAAVTIEGLVEVTGDLLIDGLQPIVI